MSWDKKIKMRDLVELLNIDMKWSNEKKEITLIT